ncbi:hypothetical protein ABT112_26885 [Streptomyces sp. NPDC002055]|uniref:hypothetical protein n=1 Tax=Streptomyces sp. NPDC002055 TaxID=3154534 RepID=UPI00331C2227
MTEIAFTKNFVTQQHLGAAYRRLGHTSTAPAWSATLLISSGLGLSWACPVLAEQETTETSALSGWHVIAEAGELDWPPLRPEEEIWPALLELHPVPTGEAAEQQARFLGAGTVEEWHREKLRRHYLSDAHIGSAKRNPSDVNFDPVVRDWETSARELADFIDSHRPPKLTTEQRVMAQGVRLAQLEAEVEATKESLSRLMRNARRDQGERPRRGFKADLARWSGASRPTVDTWLSGGGCCEAVPDEDGTTHQGHTHDMEEQTR